MGVRFPETKWRPFAALAIATGAVVLMTWACALWSIQVTVPQDRHATLDGVVDSEWPANWPAQATRIQCRAGFGIDTTQRLATMGGEVYSQTVVTAGWPLRCLAGEARSIDHNFGGWVDSVEESTLWAAAVPAAIVRTGMGVRIAPLRPLWSGLVFNTLVWTLLVALAIRCGEMIRSSVRRRAGKCGRCGYSIGSIGPCPECGLAR